MRSHSLSRIFWDSDEIISCFLSFLFLRRSTGRRATVNSTTCRQRRWPISWWCSTGSSSAACTRSECAAGFDGCSVSVTQLQPTNERTSSSLVSPAGGVCVLRVSRRAVALAPPEPGAGTAAVQRGAALGRHGDPAVSVAAEEDPAAPQVHQDRSAVSPRTNTPRTRTKLS